MGRLRLLVVVPFLNEAEYISTFLGSLAKQQRPPDEVLLVDDGSTDGSLELAGGFASGRAGTRVIQRPRRSRDRDRLAAAQAWRAFCWGVEQADGEWDLVAKLDADLRLSYELCAEMERRFLADPSLGIAGAYLSASTPDGRLARQRCPEDHVEGPTRFYRRACLEAISPIPPIVGWDTIDEVRARMRGWRTRSFEIPGGDPIHLRRMGSYDGVLRGYRRAGWAAYSYGAHPLQLLGSACVRLRDRPPLACAAAYLGGYAGAALRREPRAEPEARAFLRREQAGRLVARVGARP
jgi:glycosyltransferase involved in cell wall biosynthesis